MLAARTLKHIMSLITFWVPTCLPSGGVGLDMCNFLRVVASGENPQTNVERLKQYRSERNGMFATPVTAETMVGETRQMV